MSELQQTFSPVDNRLLVERPLATRAELDALLDRATAAFGSWRSTTVSA